MTTISPHSPKKVIIAFFIAWMILILIAILSSCKTRKLQKDYSKLVDKSEQSSTVRDFRTVEESTTAKVQIAIKETVQSTNNYDEVETTKIYKDSVVIIKKSKGQKQSQSDKVDFSKMDWIENHSEIKEIDSIGTRKNNIKEIKAVKKLESKGQPVKIWIGFALFLIIVGGAIIIYIKKYTKR